MAMQDYPNQYPFMGVSMDATVGSLGVLCYCAYNAMGLIGPESNGIAVVDRTENLILCDEICKEQTGYFGPSQKQIKFFNEFIKKSEAEIREYIKTQSRYRGGY